LSFEIIWWLLAIVLGLAELFTGTFFLLIVALGAVVAGFAAYFGFDVTWQIFAAVLGTLIGAAVLKLRNKDRPAPSDRADPDRPLDIGARVEVTHWVSARRSEVRYRGASWQVELAGHVASGAPGTHTIERIDGNTLIVVPSNA